MGAIKLDDFCKEWELDRKEVDDLRRKLGIKCKKRDNVWTITAEESSVLLKELDLPKELKSETYWAYGIHGARNPRWVWCKIEGIENKHPVLIPPRFYKTLIRKRFPVERIEDKDGVTWRHEWFRKLAGYNR